MELSESELLAFKSLCQDRARCNNVVNLIADYEGDPEGLKQSLTDGIDADDAEDNPRHNVYRFDPTLILLLIKLAPVIWVLVTHVPDIIEFIRALRSAKQSRQRRRRRRQS